MVASRVFWQKPIPAWVIFVTLTACLGTGLLLLLALVGLHPGPRAVPPVPVRPHLPAGAYPAGPLAVSVQAPELVVAGWLNTAPPAWGAAAPQLTVLDIWAHW